MRKITTKCLALLCAVAMRTTVPLPIVSAADSLVINGTFESGKSGWDTYHQTVGVCSLGTDDGRLALKMSSVGDVAWAVQVYYDIITLYQNGVYHLSYRISYHNH